MLEASKHWEAAMPVPDTWSAQIRRSTRRWILASAAAWAVLVAAAVWVKEQQGPGWPLLEAALDALASGFAAVVLAGLIFDRVRDRLEARSQAMERARAERRWLDEVYPYALVTHRAVRHLLGLAADLLYRTIATTGALVVVIPAENLRWDVQRSPHPPPDLRGIAAPEANDAEQRFVEAAKEDLVRARYTGPMAVASVQLQFLESALLCEFERAANDAVAAIMGDGYRRQVAAYPVDVGPGLRRPVPQEQFDRLDRTVLAALTDRLQGRATDDLAELAHRIYALTPELQGPPGFDPVPLRRALLVALVRAERLRLMLDAGPGWGDLVSFDGTTQAGDEDLTWEPARRAVVAAASLFTALAEIREQVFTATGALHAAALRISEDAARIVIDQDEGTHVGPKDDVWGSPVPRDGILSGYAEWDLWRRRNGLYFEAPDPAGATA